MRAPRLFRACVGLLLALTAIPAAHAGASANPRPSGWVITRTGRGLAVFHGTFQADAQGSGATAMLFALAGRGGARSLDGRFSTTEVQWGADGWVTAFGTGVPWPECVSVTCDDQAHTHFAWTIHSNGHPMPGPIYVAAWDAATSVTVDVPGWRVRPWTPSMRVVRSDGTGGAGVRVLHSTAGTFEGAEADGGRYGSIAAANLPCSTAGEGHAVFSGGDRSFDLDCPYLADSVWGNAGRTRWKITGESTGDGGIVNVLVVVDYPKG